jgi:hypothetical protein
MLLMIVNAGVPLLNLHQAGADAAGAQMPGSSAKTPICDFRSANEITISIAISAGKLDLIECGPAAEQDQPLHDHIPLYFIAAYSTPAKRASATLFLRERGEHDRTAHINGMLATSHSCRTRYAAAGASTVPNPVNFLLADENLSQWRMILRAARSRSLRPRQTQVKTDENEVEQSVEKIIGTCVAHYVSVLESVRPLARP